MTELRILLVDDHAFYREGVKAMLAATGAAVRVVGEAASGEDAVELARGLVPDVVVMDIRLPGMSGLEATRRILAEQPTTPILMLTMANDETVLAAVRAGARGYLLKDASIGALVRALFAVYEGQAIFSPESASRVVEAAIGLQRSAPPFPELTEREREVLTLLSRGLSNSEIGAELHLTLKTVRNYVSAILVKLGVRDRTQAVIRATEAGLN